MGGTVTGEHKEKGKFLNAQSPSHPPWNQRLQLTFCPHKPSLCDTPGMLKPFSFFFFFTKLGNYRSGHGAQSRDRDPGRYDVTAPVSETALCIVLLKPDLPTNSSLTSLQHPVFGAYNAGRLVYCVASMIPNIPMWCASFLLFSEEYLRLNLSCVSTTCVQFCTKYKT